MSNNATERQINLINALQEEREWFEGLDFGMMPEKVASELISSNPESYSALCSVKVARELWSRQEFTTKAASRLIDCLKRAPLKTSVDDAVGMMVRNMVPSGRYAVQWESGIAFYLVTKYNKVLRMVGDSHENIDAGQRRRALEAIRKDPKAASLLYGQEIGKCGVCGRTLTDADSRANGIGPVCAAKRGW